MRTAVWKRRMPSLAMAGIMSSCALIAQKPGPPAGGGTGGPPTTRNPNTTPNTPLPPPAGNSSMGLFLTGTVLLEDGTPPPQPATIERLCGNTPRAQAYTDAKGWFSFQIGQTNGVLQDASEQGSTDPAGIRQFPTNTPAGRSVQQSPTSVEQRLDNCELRAVLAGYRSDRISLTGRRLMDDPNVGTIVLHRLANVEGSAVSVLSLQAPSGARRAFEKGRQYLRKNNLADAADEYLKAVKIYPKYAIAWYELGMVQARTEDMARARQSFENALAADPKYLSPYFPLIEMAAIAESWSDVESITAKVLKLDPVDYPMAYFYHATANLRLGRIDIAESSARAGEKMDTEHKYPRLEAALGAILERKRDYAGAIEHLKSYLALAPDAADAARVKSELERLERRVGDEEQASRVSEESETAPPEKRP